MAATFTLPKTGEGEFVFEFKTHSGDVLMTSSTYLDKGNAIRGADAARRLAQNARNYEICTTWNGQSYFMVRNAKGEVIAHSDMFADRECAKEVIAQAMGKTRGARLEDLTDPNIRNRAHRK
jgi:uncharacterized protein YegP (UPF0339 family)